MRFKVAYCGYVRKNGKINAVSFDTESKTYIDSDGYTSNFTFVEAKLSKDVDNLRDRLIKDGYTKEEE